MVNKSKLNKKIVTGVAAVALFAPLALHSAQVNAADSSSGGTPTAKVDKSGTTTQDNNAIKTIVNSDKVGSIYLKGQSSGITKDKLHDSDVSNIDHIVLSDGVTVPNPDMKNTENLSSSLNTPAPHHNGSDLKSALTTDGVQAVHFKDNNSSVTTDKIDNNGDYTLGNIDGINVRGNSTSVDSSKINGINSLNEVVEQVKNNNDLKSTLSDEGIQAVHFNDNNGDVNTNDIKSDGNYTLKDISNVTFDNAKNATYIDASNANDTGSLKDAINKDKPSTPVYHNGNDLKSVLIDEGIQAVHFNGDKNVVNTTDINNDGDYTLKDINNVTFGDSNGSIPINASNINDIKSLNNALDQIKPDSQGKSNNQDSKDQESVKNSINDFQDRINNDKSQIKDAQNQLNAKQNQLNDDQQQLAEFNSDQQNDESGQSNAAKDTINANKAKEAVQNSINDFKGRINDDKGQVKDAQNQLSAKQSQLNDDQQQLAEFGHSTGQNVDINGKAQPSNNNSNNNNNNNNGGNNNNNNNNNNVAPSNSGIVNIPTNSSNANNTNANNTTPKTNDNSAQISFPDVPSVAPQHKAKHHKASTRKAKKVSAKQMKSDKASVKKNQKHLKAVKKALRKAKGKARKAKLNKQLKRAKKAFAKSEKKLNHAIHSAK